MLDSSGRIVIGKELLSRTHLSINQEIEIFFDNNKKKLLILPKNESRYDDNLYYIRTHNLDEHGRIHIPKCIRRIFPKATYLPTEKDGEICILIIEH